MFSSHNVRLPGGSETAPGRPLVAESSACVAAMNELYRAFGTMQGLTLADLGCLEGGYAAEFARAGYSVVGFEAREENISNATLLRDTLGFSLDQLRFVQGDVRETLKGRKFDVVFCSGLLYHLDKPVEFLKLLAEVTSKLLILNTHYSMGPGGHPEGSHQPGYGCDFGPHVNEGRHGHWCTEGGSRWDAYGNKRSFWLEKEEIFDVLKENGFATVNEVSDWWGYGSDSHVQGGPGRVPDRGMFTALKP